MTPHDPIREALKPFADAYAPEAEARSRQTIEPEFQAALDRNSITPSMKMGDFRRAYEAYHAISAPAKGAEEPEWIAKLRHEVMMSKATESFSLTRNEVMDLLGMPSLAAAPVSPSSPLTGEEELKPLSELFKLDLTDMHTKLIERIDYWMLKAIDLQGQVKSLTTNYTVIPDAHNTYKPTLVCGDKIITEADLYDEEAPAAPVSDEREAVLHTASRTCTEIYPVPNIRWAFNEEHLIEFVARVHQLSAPPAQAMSEEPINLTADDMHWFESAFKAWECNDFVGVLEGLSSAINHFRSYE